MGIRYREHHQVERHYDQRLKRNRKKKDPNPAAGMPFLPKPTFFDALGVFDS